MQTAGKQKNKKYNVNRIRSGAVALCAALLLLLSDAERHRTGRR